MESVFTDKWNATIRLTAERIKHIAKHMELYNKMHLIEETLQHPEIISSDEEQEGIWYYQRYLREENLFFIIVVKRTESEGFIVTIFKSKRLKQK